MRNIENATSTSHADEAHLLLAALARELVAKPFSTKPIAAGIRIVEPRFDLVVDLEAANFSDARTLRQSVLDCDHDLLFALVGNDPALTKVDVVLREFASATIISNLSFWQSSSGDLWLCDLWHSDRNCVAVTGSGLVRTASAPWQNLADRSSGFVRAATRLRRAFGQQDLHPAAFDCRWW